jgi:L-lactate utilization protein LutC
MDNTNYNSLASTQTVEKTKKALEEHGISVYVAKDNEDAKQKIYSLLPEGSEVMTASSITLETLGITKTINESGKYNSVKAKLMKLNRETDARQMQKLGAAPEYIIGSVHAVTENGQIIVASNTGSQLPGYSYGSAHVIWVVSTKKIVKDIESGFERINKHIVPLEDVHMKQLYGSQSGTNLRKILIFNSESNPNRITLVFVPEDLGF